MQSQHLLTTGTIQQETTPLTTLSPIHSVTQQQENTPLTDTQQKLFNQHYEDAFDICFCFTHDGEKAGKMVKESFAATWKTRVDLSDPEAFEIALFHTVLSACSVYYWANIATTH